MTETMTTSEVLNRAADLIEERGWWRKPASADYTPGSTCAAIAILNVAGLGDDRYEGIYAFGAYLGWRDGDPQSIQQAIWTWNDADGRTASEVVEVLRACAVIEASREREAATVTV